MLIINQWKGRLEIHYGISFSTLLTVSLQTLTFPYSKNDHENYTSETIQDTVTMHLKTFREQTHRTVSECGNNDGTSLLKERGSTVGGDCWWQLLVVYCKHSLI